MNNIQEQIHEKGFDMNSNYSYEYGKIKVGLKTLEDAVLDTSCLKKVEKNYGNKLYILNALHKKDVDTLRDISDFFFRTSGIYERVCKYFATMYRYDWYIVPEIYNKDKIKKEDVVLQDFHKILTFLDNSYIAKTCNDIALKVIKDGAYYGYITDNPNCVELQELPARYCRSRYNIGHRPAIEFDMSFFDEQFSDPEYRNRILKLFPKEFLKGYMLYKQGKLQPDYLGDTKRSWYLLEPTRTVKFSLNNNDIPFFINAIPAIIDLDAAQELDRKKQMQKLLKILVQKLPMDKNGDLIFDIDEARDIHNNAVEMLRKAIGVDVLTTFADIESIDMSDKNTSTSKDDLEKVERTVFNSFGISQNLFNTDGNLSLEKSILNDEGAIRNLLMQFEIFFDMIAQAYSPSRKLYTFRLYMLETTQYNYKELSKLYKEQTQIGYSKMLPQIALGHSQSSILNTAYFENDILHLSEVMIPPMMSSTVSMEDIKSSRGGGENDKAGRPEKEESEKSDKTLQNEESMS